ncbi:MAG: hypothetical protein US49_C0001G0127 [candidate division TM6 bacterium GW2011_GWF2_37_49]|nr:MAG: hypothetical protein US49_C0001G0127 [candidate division TM6 bacterium GW2011_GWF2_37_49]
MKKQGRVNFFVIISLFFCIFQTYAELQHQEIQDVIINNVVVQRGLGDCERCYEAIKPLLNQYKRPITVLDLGAGHGYFSFRIAGDYDSTCVMVESNDRELKWADQLLELCRLNSKLQNVILLNKKMTLEEIEKLADCEHFDVILAFDYIDYKSQQRQMFLDAILRLGDNIFIQTTSLEAQSEKHQRLSFQESLAGNGGRLILQTSSVCDTEVEESLFWFQRKKDRLNCKCFIYKDNDKKSFCIKSTYTQKILIKDGCSSRITWKKGINLVTFLMLNGVYPTKEKMKQEIAKLTRQKLTDFLPKNLIVQGNNIELIDQNDKCRREANLSKSLKFINDAIDKTSQSEVEKLLKQEGSKHKRKYTHSWIFRMFGL